MPNLKELRTRKKSVQATKKITSAMKLIAGAKLKRAQEKAQAARPYAMLMSQMLSKILMAKNHHTSTQDAHLPTTSHGYDDRNSHNKVLIIVATSNRGLCGGFNSSIVRHVRHCIDTHKSQQDEVKLICIGQKGYEQLQRNYGADIVKVFQAYDKPSFYDAHHITDFVLNLFHGHAFDICLIVYNKFVSALSQKVTEHRLIPYSPLEVSSNTLDMSASLHTNTHAHANTQNIEANTDPYFYAFEPSEQSVLDKLIPKNLAVQIFGALLENIASEHGARMAAMESATRNAEDMIRQLDLKYNRLRQASITKELIEIISGAEAL